MIENHVWPHEARSCTIWITHGGKTNDIRECIIHGNAAAHLETVRWFMGNVGKLERKIYHAYRNKERARKDASFRLIYVAYVILQTRFSNSNPR